MSMGPRIIVENWGIPYEKPSQRPRLQRVLRAIDRIWGKAVTRKSPITVAHLKAMAKCVTNKSSNVRKVVFVAMVMAFFSLVRKSAYCAAAKDQFDPLRQLTVGDLRVTEARYSISLQLTKTIQFTERELTILLPYLDNEICHTILLHGMMKNRKNCPLTEPLFVVDEAGTPLTKHVFLREFNSLLKDAGIPTDDKAPHSLRRGGTTCAFECGCNPACIKVQGDWVSDAYLVYIWVTNTLKRQVINTWEGALGSA